MMSVEQDKFLLLVRSALADYVKSPTQQELDTWWATCRGFLFVDVERALNAHAEGENGARAPRPIDVKRILGSSTRSGAKCSVAGANGGCQYPGIFSEGSNGGGPWVCPWHRVDRVGPEAQRWIDVSQQVPYEEAQAKRAARMLAEAIRTPNVVETAHKIALRHGSRPWQGHRFVDPRPGQNPDAEEAA